MQGECWCRCKHVYNKGALGNTTDTLPKLIKIVYVQASVAITFTANKFPRGNLNYSSKVCVAHYTAMIVFVCIHTTL